MSVLVPKIKAPIPLIRDTTVSTVVTAYDEKTGEVTLSSERDGEMRFFAHRFFGVDFDPIPKVGQTLMVEFRSFDKKIIEAWYPKTTQS